MAGQAYTVDTARGRIGLAEPVKAVTTHGTRRQIKEVAFDRFASGRRVYLRGYEEIGSVFYVDIAKQMVLDTPGITDNPGAWVSFDGRAVRIGNVVPR